MTEQERINLIRNAFQAPKAFEENKSVEDFIAEVKTEEVFAEHGLLRVQNHDLVDEMELLDHNPIAESIDEEDEGFGVSDQMKGVYHDS